MTLVVEDGSGVADADTLVSADAAAAFFTRRGILATADEWSGPLLLAMDILAAERYRGAKSSTANRLPFPRTGIADPDDAAYAGDAVPPEAVEAQLWLAQYIRTGSDPGAAPEPAIREETVGPITTKFAVSTTQTTSGAFALTDLPHVAGRLSHLLAPDSSSGTPGSTVRGGLIDRA